MIVGKFSFQICSYVPIFVAQKLNNEDSLSACSNGDLLHIEFQQSQWISGEVFFVY